MTLTEIKKEAKNNKGLKETAKILKYAFGISQKTLNKLVEDGTFEISGKDHNNNLIYEVV